MARNECPKSPSGKHVWTVNVKEDSWGNKTQYRRCDYCHLKQRHEKSWGQSKGWKSI